MEISHAGLNKVEKFQLTDEKTIKCYLCFSTDVEYVCHHCGRYICKNCEPKPIRLLHRLGLYRFLFKDHQFFDLYPLENRFRSSAHCQDHIHYEETIINFLVWIIGCLGSILLLLSQFFDDGNMIIFRSSLVAVISFIILLPSRGLIYRMMLTDRSEKTFLLFPRYNVEITESLGVNFKIDEKEGYLSLDPTLEDRGGKIRVKIIPTPDDYERYRHLNGSKHSHTLNFSAGYLSLDHLSQVIFNQKYPHLKFHDGSSMKGTKSIDHAGRLPLVGQIPRTTLKTWTQTISSFEIEQPYEISDKAGWVGPEFDQEFPFWIIPDLALAGRELSLSILVTPHLEKALKLDYFRLSVPDLWREQVTKTNGLFDDVTGKVYWVQPNLHRGINRFFVRFDRPIECGIEIQGDFKVLMKDALLTKLKMEQKKHLWFVNGQPVKRTREQQSRLEKVELKTCFTGNFHINTAVFRLQREFTCEAQGEQRSCRPDHSVISEIAEVLAHRRIDVKTIVETPARIGEVRPGARYWDRYWEINGRHYLEEKLQYVEVHVVVYGQENQANPEDNEYVRWQLHLRSGIPLHNRSLEDRLKQFRNLLKQDIEQRLAQCSISIHGKNGVTPAPTNGLLIRT